MARTNTPEKQRSPRSAEVSHDVPAAPEPTGWTIGSGCTVGANAPEPTEVAVNAIPIVV